MEQLSLVSKKIFSFLLIFFISFSLVFGLLIEVSFAQEEEEEQEEIIPGLNEAMNAPVDQPNATGERTETVQVTTDGTSEGTTITGPTNTQANTNAQGVQDTSRRSVSGQGITNGIAGCVGTIASNAVSGVISQLTAKSASTDTYTRVGITSADTVARAGDSNGSYPSLDSIGYCIINAVLEILTDATIKWINEGFDGNPAFVENPEQFFKDLADVETAGFLREVVGGATGMDICQPFRLQIVTGLAGNTGDPYRNQSRCTFDDISQSLSQSGVKFDYNDYTSGRSPYSGSLDAWRSVTQNDSNNPYGAYFMAQQELQKRLSVKQNTAQLDLSMGRGFLSFKHCTEDSTTNGPDGKPVQVKGTCGVTTPGAVIESQLNNRLSSGNNRLVLADKFDQVITALVTALIKTALNEVLVDDEAQGQQP